MTKPLKKIKAKWYTIYDAKTDKILASGFAKDCAAEMNMEVASFHSLVSRALSGERDGYVAVVETVILQSREREEMIAIRKEGFEKLNRLFAEMERKPQKHMVSAMKQKQGRNMTAEEWIHFVCRMPVAVW